MTVTNPQGRQHADKYMAYPPRASSTSRTGDLRRQASPPIAGELQRARPAARRLYVSGTYTKSLTLASADDIIIKSPDGTRTTAILKRDGDVRARPDRRQLRARLPQGQTVDREPCSNVDTTANPLMDTSRSRPRSCRSQHSFIVDNWNCGAKLDDAQRVSARSRRSTAARSAPAAPSPGGTGFQKVYNYDDRLTLPQPAVLPRPGGRGLERDPQPTSRSPRDEVSVPPPSSSPAPAARRPRRRASWSCGSRSRAGWRRRGTSETDALRFSPARPGDRARPRARRAAAAAARRRSRSPRSTRARRRRATWPAGCRCCAGSPGPRSCRARRASRAGCGRAAAAARCRRSPRTTRPTAPLLFTKPLAGELVTPQLRARVGRGARRALAARRAGRARPAAARRRHDRRAGGLPPLRHRPAADRPRGAAGDAPLAADRRPRRSGDPRARARIRAPPRRWRRPAWAEAPRACANVRAP